VGGIGRKVPLPASKAINKKIDIQIRAKNNGQKFIQK
jgi:hypothetical protein